MINYATTTNIPYVATSHTLTITNGDPDHTYAWGIGALTKGTGAYTNSSTITISTTSGLPDAGGSSNYEVLVKRGNTSGGSNSYVSITTSLTANRYPQTPSGLTTFTDAGTEAASGTFTIAVGALSGASSTTITLSSNYTQNAVANGSAIANVARAGDIVYARNTGANNLIASAAVSTPATYLLPNTPSLPNVSNAYNTGSHTINITSMPTTVYYEVRTGSYTGTQRGASTTGGGGSPKNITVTQINTGGDTVTYYVRGYRLVSAGGDAQWDNLGTYTVTEAAADVTPSTFTFAPVAAVLSAQQTSNLITVGGLSSGISVNVSVSGGTYSKNGTGYANTNTTAVNGDTFRLQHMSSGTNNTDVDTTLIIGGVSGTFTSTTAAITAPTISYVQHNNSAAANVTAAVNLLTNGSGGTLKYAQTTSNSVPSSGWQTSSSFSHPRGTTRYYFASQDEDTSGAYNYDTLAVGYLTGDVDTSPQNVSIAFNITNASVVLNNATSGETYAVRDVNGASNFATATASGTSVTVGPFTNSLPSGAGSTTYEIFVQRPTSTGGNGSTFTDTDDQFVVTRSAAITAPTAFTIPDRTGDPSSVLDSFTIITGINSAATISVASTTATWAVSSSQTLPASSAFGTSANSITNNQYLHVRQTTSSSYSTTLSTVFTVGGITDTFSVSTNAQPGSEAGTAGYGFKQYDSNGHLIVDSTSSVKTFITYYQGLTITLYPASLGNTATYPNTFDVTVPGLTSQEDFLHNYVVTRTDGGSFSIFGNATHGSAYYAANTIRFTWAGTCSGSSCSAFDVHASTFDISIIGKTL